MKRYILFSILPLFLVVISTAAGQVVSSPHGTVEFIGLKQWSAQKLLEKLGALSQQATPFDYEGLLTERLDFADAAVFRYTGSDEKGNETGVYWVVTVVEPQDTNRVRYQSPPEEESEKIAAWDGAIGFVRDHLMQIEGVIDAYGNRLANGRDAASIEGVEAGSLAELWRFLEGKRSESDKKLALRTLVHDGDASNRSVAVMILMNFHTDDDVWRSLMDAQRDEANEVRFMASSAIATLAGNVPRNIDWTPSAATLRLLLNGTNLLAFPSTVDALLKTGVRPDLAARLLAGNGELLLAHIRAQHNDERELAHALLTRLSGKDFGYDARKWEEWIKSTK